MREMRDATEPIRVLLVDDQALLRESFRRLLELEGEGIEVVGAAGDGQEALALVERLAQSGRAPHVALMDVRMPRMDGVQATALLRERFPDVRVLILTTFDDEQPVFDGLKAGAQGYLLKDVTAEQLVEAIRAVHRGESPLQPSVAAKLVARLTDLTPNKPPAGGPEPPVGDLASPAGRGEQKEPPHTAADMPMDDLTEREREILRYVAHGDNNREIGEALFITEGTVKNHVSNILSKLGLRDRTQAALWAREHGLA
jgi:DNA-binding NarL/FixJ family response regulator